MVLRLALRNLWRQRRRMGVIGFTLTVGALLILVGLAFVNGMERNWLNLITGTMVGDLGVTSPGDDKLVLFSTRDLVRAARETEGVEVAERIEFNGMLVKDERSAPASVRGIDVETEWRLLRTLQNATGDKLGLVARPGEKVPVAISPQMAADLEVEVGAELTLTGMTVDGAGFAEEVRVAYIFEGNVKNAALDLWVLMPLDDARRLIGASGSVANAVRVFLPDPEAEATVRAALEAAVGDRELSVRSWRETDEADWMTSVYVWKGVLYFFVGMLALLIVMGTFGVISATTLERMREVGTMRAIGMTPLQAFGVLVAELLLVGVLAGAVAVGLALVILALTRGGVEATTEAMALSFGGRWLYPTLSAGVLAAGFVFTVTLAVVSGLAPISRSATVREIDALRHL